VVQVGSHLEAVFLRTLKREDELLYEFSLRNHLLNSPERINGQLGIISNEENPQALSFFQREQLLPLDYQILHDRSFENLGGYDKMINELQLERHGTLACWSNKPLLGELDLHYERLLFHHNRQHSENTESPLGQGVFHGSAVNAQARRLPRSLIVTQPQPEVR